MLSMIVACYLNLISTTLYDSVVAQVDMSCRVKCSTYGNTQFRNVKEATLFLSNTKITGMIATPVFASFRSELL